MNSYRTRDELQRLGFSLLDTADYDLLDQPLTNREDVHAIEARPLTERLALENFSTRVDLALASRRPNDIAIHYVPDGNPDTPVHTTTFLTLQDQIARTASLLHCADSARTVSAVLMPAVPLIYPVLLGAMRAGIVFPINWMLEPEHLLHLLLESQATRIIALGPTPGFQIWESLQSIRPQLPADVQIYSVAGPGEGVLESTDLECAYKRLGQHRVPQLPEATGQDIAAYVHSGGTTGRPKIVKLSHRNLSFRHWSLQLALKSVPGEVILHDTPMFHVGGLTGRCLPPLASGASVLIPSVMGARDKRYIANYWKFVEKFRVTRLSAVPTTLAVLIKNPPQGDDLSSLNPYFITGSTAMPVAVREAFERIAGVRVLNSYGMTENTASIAIDPRDGVPKEGASGLRLPYTEVRAAIMGPQGQTLRLCETNEIGMLQIRSPGLTPGYLNPDHDRTSRTPDGWFITGDLGRIDADEYVFVTGRAKDVIIRGGHNIDPGLIEEPLAQSPDVMLAAAVGKPDAYAGELPIAYVQLQPGSTATASDLLSFLETRINERAAVPKEIHILERLPLTDIGKPMKTALRQMAAEAEFHRLLTQAMEFDPSDVIKRLTVRVEPHPSHGTLATIILIGIPEPQQEALTHRAKTVMASFAMASTIEHRPYLEME